MFENFKTDIIYYNTGADFELEFNLCGCCRMRLFNDKCSDKKSLLLSLSRAVSRSRVVIITAPLFSEDNVIHTIAAAIGSSTEIVDNAKYKITSDSEISVIKDSLPLVTEDGIFGGCIIESGPQSLIILTENKGVRKTLMKNLIHQYIADVSVRSIEADDEIITEDPEEPTENVPTEEETTEKFEEELVLDEETEPSEEPVIEETELPEDKQLIIDSEEESEEEAEEAPEEYYSEEENLYTDISSESDNAKNSDHDSDYDADFDYYTEETEEKTSPFSIWMLVISIILLVAIAVLCYCIFYVPTTLGESPATYLKDVFDTMFK